jgi:dynein heavy chain 1
MVSKLLKMQLIEDDEDLPPKESAAVAAEHSATPAWMRTLRQTAEEWLKLLPENLQSLRRTADNIKKPLYRFFEREVCVGLQLTDTVLRDLRAVKQICQGEKKQMTYHRKLISELVRGLIPDSWRGRYPIPPGCTVINWINDLALRINQLITISKTVSALGADQLDVRKIKNYHDSLK